ncbi:MAG: DUF5320 domain-containing protein [Patescibacteria group bacterium]
MPRLDGTGPRGYGARTGCGMCPCGYGMRRFWSKENESLALEEEQKILEEELKALKEEIRTLKEDK